MAIDFTVENVTSGSMNKSWFGIEVTISAGAELEDDYELNSYFPDGSFKWLWEYEQHLKLMPIPFCITGLLIRVKRCQAPNFESLRSFWELHEVL